MLVFANRQVDEQWLIRENCVRRKNLRHRNWLKSSEWFSSAAVLIGALVCKCVSIDTHWNRVAAAAACTRTNCVRRVLMKINAKWFPQHQDGQHAHTRSADSAASASARRASANANAEIKKREKRKINKHTIHTLIALGVKDDRIENLKTDDWKAATNSTASSTIT